MTRKREPNGADASKSEQKKWQSFELSVARFLKAWDPQLTVRHDFKEPDKHTRRPRQRDVWIETRVAGIFPLSILISCKRYARKLNQADIDHFHGERLASSGELGVLYSYSGFNDAALKKAIALNISCCTLLENQPPSIPEQLVLHAYCCRPCIGIFFSKPIPDAFSDATWSDVFELKLSGRGDVLNVLTGAYAELEASALESISPANQFPHPQSREYALTFEDENFRIEMCVDWKIFRARLSAYLLSGTYSFTDKTFHGTMESPYIDKKGPHPGEGWELIESVPERGSQIKCVAIMSQPNDVRGTILAGIGGRKLNEG